MLWGDFWMTYAKRNLLEGYWKGSRAAATKWTGIQKILEGKKGSIAAKEPLITATATSHFDK